MTRIRLTETLREVQRCQLCAGELPHPPRPVIRASVEARILIIGQAPGVRVHQSGVPWDDPSGDRLRDWMGLSSNDFYDESQVAIMPMGFCYPGKGRAGDLPPRKECAPHWHSHLLACLPNIQLTLLIGRYAQHYYLTHSGDTVTDTVKDWRAYLPEYLVLPHPSPRNFVWLSRNPWFTEDLLPVLKRLVRDVLEPV